MDKEELEEELSKFMAFMDYAGFDYDDGSRCLECEAILFPGHICYKCGKDNS